MHILDWIVVGAFLAVSVLIGLWFSKRAARSKEDFFLAGRNLGWFVAGTSIVATTFSSDTPQWVAGHTRAAGISGNWIWWTAAIGHIAAVYFLARYWRKSNALTDIDLIRLRYEPGPAASTLRTSKAFFDGVFVNCGIMASVTLGMITVLKIAIPLHPDPETSLALWNNPVWSVGLPDLAIFPDAFSITYGGLIAAGLTIFVLVYCGISGLYGVVYTDLIQFLLAMIGTTALAVIAYVHASGGDGLMDKLGEADFGADKLALFPDLSLWNIETFTLLVFLGVFWWKDVPVYGFHIQRLLATKNEKHALGALLWFNISHYALRSWPWIIVGVLAVVYFPDLANPEQGYARMIDRFMPIGLRGLIVTAFLAAYMSTMSTHLNWGASYLVNDVLLASNRGQTLTRAKQILFARSMTVVLAVVVGILASLLTGMLEVYKFLAMFWSGMAVMLLVRWYWWRVNAVTELTCVVATFICGIAVYAAPVVSVIQAFYGLIGLWDGNIDAQPDPFPMQVILMTLGMPLIWLPVAFLTHPKPGKAEHAFYKQVRPSSPGWRRVAQETGLALPKGGIMLNLASWLGCVAAVYGFMLGMGYALFHKWGKMSICILIMAAGTAVVIGMQHWLKQDEDAALASDPTTSND